MAGVSPGLYLELLTTGKYSDFIIDCQGYEFRVHRSVVCTASWVLDKACDGSFRVRLFALLRYDVLTAVQEANEGRINLSEDDPAILARVILYLYTNDYEAETLPAYFTRMTQNPECQTASATSSARGENPDVSSNALNIHVLVYKVADMLGIEQLRVESSSRALAKAKTLLDCDSFAEPLETIFVSTSDKDVDLRRGVLSLCAENYDTVDKHPGVVDVILRHEPNVWYITNSLLKDTMRKKLIIEETLPKAHKTHHFCAGCKGVFALQAVSKLTVDDSLDVKAWCAFCDTQNTSTGFSFGQAIR